MRVIHVSVTLRTSAVPTIAPTSSSSKPCTRMRSASGSRTESESTNATTSASVARMPAAMAARLPRLTSKSMKRTRPPAAYIARRISLRVSSVEPSLTTTTSSFSAG